MAIEKDVLDQLLAGRNPDIYSLHAPKVECIGKGKARKPYEFGRKVSIVTPVTAPKSGQFVPACQRRCTAIPTTAKRSDRLSPICKN